MGPREALLLGAMLESKALGELCTALPDKLLDDMQDAVKFCGLHGGGGGCGGGGGGGGSSGGGWGCVTGKWRL